MYILSLKIQIRVQIRSSIRSGRVDTGCVKNQKILNFKIVTIFSGE